MATIQLTLDIKKCTKCHFVESHRTKGAGFALDYFCTEKDNREIAGYVEWDSDMPLVPEWCPHLVKN